MNYFNKCIHNIKSYLNSHPKVKGGVIIAEGAAAGAINSWLQSGTVSFNSHALKALGVSIVISVYLAVKNYITIQAKAEVSSASTSTNS